MSKRLCIVPPVLCFKQLLITASLVFSCMMLRSCADGFVPQNLCTFTVGNKIHAVILCKQNARVKRKGATQLKTSSVTISLYFSDFSIQKLSNSVHHYYHCVQLVNNTAYSG